MREIRAKSPASSAASSSVDRLDLMLLDINMPEADGFGVLLMLRADEPTREIPVIMVTASG